MIAILYGIASWVRYRPSRVFVVGGDLGSAQNVLERLRKGEL